MTKKSISNKSNRCCDAVGPTDAAWNSQVSRGASAMGRSPERVEQRYAARVEVGHVAGGDWNWVSEKQLRFLLRARRPLDGLARDAQGRCEEVAG
jgi:hypothetical protein